MLFDAANPDASTAKRTVSTVAPQSLLLLNHVFVLDLAAAFSLRVQHEVPSDDGRIQYAYSVLFGRLPNALEIAVARRLLERARSQGHAAWDDLAHVLLCSNEFIYLD